MKEVSKKVLVKRKRKILEEKPKNRLAASWELMHRLFLMAKAISFFWCGVRKDFRDKVCNLYDELACNSLNK